MIIHSSTKLFFKLYWLFAPFLVSQGLATNAATKPVEINVEYSGVGKKEIHVSAVNTTGEDLKGTAIFPYFGFVMHVHRENAESIQIPGRWFRVDTVESPFLWKKDTSFRCTFEEREFQSLAQGKYRINIMWNGGNEYALDKADFSVKNLSFEIDEKGDWTLEADELTTIHTMTYESFSLNHPYPIGVFAVSPTLIQDGSSPNPSKQLKAVNLRRANPAALTNPPSDIMINENAKGAQWVLAGIVSMVVLGILAICTKLRRSV